MALKELTEEQVRTMTLEEKDRWWLTHVYKGNMPQLTIRSALTGIVLGSVLSLTNLYVGIRTGWTLGVGITSVILSFGLFKFLSKVGLGKEMSILENNAMQSIATSAGYMTGPLVGSIPAYMLITGTVVPMSQVFWWSIFLSILGVLFAFPLKKRFINEEQLPFPEGYASAVVMDGLHSEDGLQGIFKAKILAMGAGASSIIELWRNEKVMHTIRLGFLKLPEAWDEIVYKVFTPKILGTPLKDLTISWDTSIIMMATGGIMGTRTALSLFIGAVINYFFLAPVLIHSGIIATASFKHISMWSLWGGVAMMTTSSLYSFLSKPEMILQAFKAPFKNKKAADGTGGDILADIELPLWVSAVGIPIFGAITVWMGHAFFGIDYWLGLVAIPLVFVFTLIAVNATGLTAITPTGALGKLTQLTYSVLAPGNIKTNIMTAGITGEVAGNASNLLMDIKPGYLLGAKPRQQAVGHILGIVAGSWLSIPVFYQIFHGDLSLLTSDKLPLPSVQIWKSVAEVLSKGLGFLHPSAQLAVVIGAALGILLEVLNQKTKGKFPISGTGLGLAFVLRFSDSFSMALGAFLFWIIGRKNKNPQSKVYQVFIENQETLCAGAIAGGSIIGILLILFETLG